MSTEIELEEGQTFAIGGLLDNRDTETFNKVPGLGSIPFFGNLFRSRQITKNNSELLVMVTPELVRPTPKGQSPAGAEVSGTIFASQYILGGAAAPWNGRNRAGASQTDGGSDYAGGGFDQEHASCRRHAATVAGATVTVCACGAGAAAWPGASPSVRSDYGSGATGRGASESIMERF